VHKVESAKTLGNPATVHLRITDYHTNDTHLASLHRYGRRYDVPYRNGRRNTLEDLIAVVPFLPAGIRMVGLMYSDFLRPRRMWRVPGRNRRIESLTGNR
jgi:hypothetical protein